MLSVPIPMIRSLTFRWNSRMCAPILQMLPQERTADDCVALFAGPEGGWTEEERTQAIGSGWFPCSLGKTLLRAETAALAALAVIQAAWQTK